MSRRHVQEPKPPGPELPESCARFEQLVASLRQYPLSDEEIQEYLEHEEHCPSGRHTRAQLEANRGLRPGALTLGDPEKGLPSKEESIAATMKRLRSGDPSSSTDTSTAPKVVSSSETVPASDAPPTERTGTIVQQTDTPKTFTRPPFRGLRRLKDLPPIGRSGFRPGKYGVPGTPEVGTQPRRLVQS